MKAKVLIVEDSREQRNSLTALYEVQAVGSQGRDRVEHSRRGDEMG